MTDASSSTQPRLNGADSDLRQNGQLRSWLRAMLSRKPENTWRETIEELIETSDPADQDEDAQARALLANILAIKDLTAADIMIPRADIVAVDIATPESEVLKVLAEKAHSRLPVFRGTLDEALGIIHIKDVLNCMARGQTVDLPSIIRPVRIIAPSIPVLDLLLEMRQARQQMSLVVDEYGGIDGLVTIEDLVEQIVGEIADEHELDNTPTLHTLPDGAIQVDARMEIADFVSATGLDISGEDVDDVDTLGGLVYSMEGRIPARGEILRHESGMEFEVAEADPRRIRVLRVRQTDPAAPDPAGPSDGTPQP